MFTESLLRDLTIDIVQYLANNVVSKQKVANADSSPSRKCVTYCTKR